MKTSRYGHPASSSPSRQTLSTLLTQAQLIYILYVCVCGYIDTGDTWNWNSWPHQWDSNKEQEGTLQPGTYSSCTQRKAETGGLLEHRN